MNGEKRNDNTDEHRSSTTGWEVIGGSLADSGRLQDSPHVGWWFLDRGTVALRVVRDAAPRFCRLVWPVVEVEKQNCTCPDKVKWKVRRTKVGPEEGTTRVDGGRTFYSPGHCYWLSLFPRAETAPRLL